jgi:hypothetical protein
MRFCTSYATFMKTIETHYTDLFNDFKKWNYYDQEFNNPILDKSFDSFVKQYIQSSGKGDSNPLVKTLNHVSFNGHVFSVFFLGILLYENCNSIKRQIDKIIRYYQSLNNKSKISFPFIWFIISLFHDSGYKFETDNRIKTIEQFNCEQKITSKLINPCGIPKQIFNIWDIYFKYKLNNLINQDYRKPDHGILAGILLFDTLSKTYEHLKTLNDNKDEFTYNNLFWSSKLLNIYKLCSWIVLAHNIFFLKDGVNCQDEIDSYINNGLESLIIKSNQEPVISLNEYPLLFLLCLVDSIEPYKIQTDPNIKSPLKNYKMSVNLNEIIIKFDKQIEKCQVDKLLRMNNWLKLKTIKVNDLIKINFA